MTTIIDIQKIFRDTWGYIGMPFPEVIAERFSPRVNGALPKYPVNIIPQKNFSNKGVSIYRQNSNGTMAFMPVWISEQDNFSTSYLLPNAVMSLSQKKNINSTTLVCRDGEVNEEINFGSWEIDIKGVLVGDREFPEDEMEILRNWFKKRKSLNIQNARTAICLGENEKVIISDLRFPELKGFENVQPYEIKMKSDIEFSLYID